MGQSRRQRPVRLPAKLREIRLRLGFTQAQIVERLRAVKPDLQAGHVSEYELGKREPSLIVLLHYARIADVSMEELVDDKLDPFGSSHRKARPVKKR
jgi:transcriptional regulator with XRE-family HTH domain